MNNALLQIKFKERLNKLASLDYDNIECWQITEAFNKAQLEWVRRQVNGVNQLKAGDESSDMKIDDLQVLLTSQILATAKHPTYNETDPLPSDYLYFKRISAEAKTDCCPNRSVIAYLAAEADVDNLLADVLRNPNVEWGETFATFIGNRARIYTNGKFDVENAKLTYYRKPRPISFYGCMDIATGTLSANVECELKDDVTELIIDDAVSIIAGDIESSNQYSRNKQNSNLNT
jgi:hypothetical protein